MNFPAAQGPRRAKPTWIQWLSQSFGEDPDDCDEPDPFDRNGEPSEEYELGCLILAAVFAALMGAAVALLFVVALGGAG